MKRYLLNKRIAFVCILLASEALTCGSLSAATYYVSASNGNDSWSGLLESPNSNRTDGPYSSLSRAQTAMRNSSVKTATLRSGTYDLALIWQFNTGDNGETWIAYPGETPTLDGQGVGGVNMSTGGIKNITLQGLTFQSMGSTGIAVSNADSVTFRSNNFFKCNTVCISGGHFTNSVIDSNTIDGVSPGSIAGLHTLVWYALNFWNGSSNNNITHNMIKNCEGGGIVLGTNPGDLTNSNNIIDRNIFQNTMSFNSSDGGAIYIIDGTHSSTGVQITNNIFDGVGGSDYINNWIKAIYLDDGDTDVLISGNICRNCGAQVFQLHGSDHITVTNNILDLSSSGTQLVLYQTEAGWGPDYGMSGNVFQRNIIYWSGSPSLIWNVGISPI
ncbi:MAG: right-handed parallel beta-helix repeat-containing protein, partial [Acidobacteriota bacterium]|nr:right-handed parallel beta-helix repeat-containing protein [Acidobacteriota bacterium]